MSIPILIAVFPTGPALVILTLVSAIRTLVLPHSAPDPIKRAVFLSIRWLFDLCIRWTKGYLARDRTLALCAPVSLLALKPVWLVLVSLGYVGMFRTLGIER